MLIYCLTGTLLVLLINAVIPSSINGFPVWFNTNLTRLWDNAVATEVLHARLADSEFGRRPLMIYPQYWLEQHLGLPAQFTFNLFSFIYLALCGLLIGKLSQQFLPRRNTGWAVSSFYLCFPILFAFLANICTYDDPIQLAALLGAYLMLLQRKYWGAVLLLTLSCVARETSLLLLPFFAAVNMSHKQKWYHLACWTLPLVIYLLHLNVMVPADLMAKAETYTLSRRFTFLHTNFGTWSAASESLFSAFLVLGLPLLLIVRYRRMLPDVQKVRLAIRSFLVLAAINTAIVSCCALAREARLLLLPLIFLWPLAGALLPRWWEELKRLSAPAWATALVAGMAASWLLYHPSVGGTGYFYRAYAVGYLALFLLTLICLKGNRIQTAAGEAVSDAAVRHK